MPRICVIGSANVDHTLALPRLPRPGETVSGGTLLTNLGGKGANQAVAARKLGAELRMLGAVGEDGPGREIRERLDAVGIDVSGVVAVPDAATGTALIFVDAEGRNQIGVAPGANPRLTVEMLRPYERAIAWADVVVCQLETPLPVVRWALEEAHRHGVRAILNPAPVRELPDDLLGLVAYLTPNAGEAAALAGIPIGDTDSAVGAGRRLLERGAATVIVTLGGDGALVCQRDRIVHFPAFPVAVVDTTAAGDAFNRAPAVGLAAGGPLDEAVPLAAATAALTCTRRGAQDSLPERADVERFLRSLRAGEAS